MNKVRTAVLISGRGSNMLALANAAKSDDYPAHICLVISNVPEALGLQKAADLNIPVIALDHKAYSNREAFDRILHQQLIDNDIELICCAGFMRILTPWFVKQWPNRILNIHPSLLPKYKGLNTHARALAAGDKAHGCTVHYVNEELDGGDIILQDSFDVDAQDTAQTLEVRVQQREHRLYLNALSKVAHTL